MDALFWSRVDKNGPVPAGRPDLGPCWLWTACLVRGYGRFTRSNMPVSASRAVLEEWLGRPLAVGEWALHRCDNKPCVRLTHLYAGSHADNMRDAVARDRMAKGARHGTHLHPASVRRGARNAAAKLNEATVREARRLAGEGHSMSQLAHRFGVSKSAVWFAVTGQTWGQVT